MPQPSRMTKDEFLTALRAYEQSNSFVLNPDSEHVQRIVDGVFTNLEKKGCKYCPCRLSLKKGEVDCDLLCPCDFESQESWSKWNRCWCGLYVKR